MLHNYIDQMLTKSKKLEKLNAINYSLCDCICIFRLSSERLIRETSRESKLAYFALIVTDVVVFYINFYYHKMLSIKSFCGMIFYAFIRFELM